MRFRTSHNDSEAAAKNSHIILDPDVANDGANPTTKIWKVVTPTSDDMAANRGYVDSKVGDYLPLAGGTLTGQLKIERPGGGSHLIVKKDGDVTLTIWADGSVQTTREDFDDDHLVSWGYVKEILEEYMKLQGTNQTGGEFKITNGGKTYVHVQTNNKLGLYNVQEPAEAHHAATRNYVDTQISANSGSDYTLPTATVQDLGGVKIAASGGTWVGATRINDSGTIGVVQSSNVTKGVNYKGQACVTGNSTPNASDYQQGCLIFSTATNSLYVRT